MLQNSHHQLQRGEAVYNFYALIVTTRYISGRYVSEEVVRINFPRRIPGLKEFVWRWFMLQNSHHQLQRGVAVYNFYALIVTTRYISGRYVSEEVVHVNFLRRIPGLKEAPLFCLG